jgi:hypothetical protein
MTIRQSLIDAFGTAWGGLRDAAAEAVEYSMGSEAKEAVTESMDLVGELASLRCARAAPRGALVRSAGRAGRQGLSREGRSGGGSRGTSSLSCLPLPSRAAST